MFVHLEELPRENRYFIARFFEEPVGEIEPESGQPWKPYVAICLLSIHGDTGEVKGMVSVPHTALADFRKAVSNLGLNLDHLYAFRWKDGRKRRMKISLQAPSARARTL